MENETNCPVISEKPKDPTQTYYVALRELKSAAGSQHYTDAALRKHVLKVCEAALAEIPKEKIG
jgi:hypothetical protein